MASPNVVKLVDVHFAAEGIAVNAKEFGGSGLVAVRAFQSALDEFFLEFRHGLLEKDAALNHHANQGFQLISQIARSAIRPLAAKKYPFARDTARCAYKGKERLFQSSTRSVMRR